MSSTFRVPVVRLGKIGKHPNADALEITQIEGEPCIIQLGSFKEGDIAVRIPVDAVVPLDRPEFDFLRKDEKDTARIKAVRLRGIFSMGILIPVPPDLGEVEVGDDVAAKLGVVKYLPPPPPAHMGGEQETDPGCFPVYNMESYRKHSHIFTPGEQVVVTEKIHGTNARFCLDETGKLWVGSHRCFWKRPEEYPPRNIYWRVVEDFTLESRLSALGAEYVLYGEIYGKGVQDLNYDTCLGFRVFDIYDRAKGRFVGYDLLQEIAEDLLGLATVPELYRGPHIPEEVEPLANGCSTLAEHIREGVIIRAARERWEPETKRAVLKLVSEAYLLRKGGTEYQ